MVWQQQLGWGWNCGGEKPLVGDASQSLEKHCSSSLPAASNSQQCHWLPETNQKPKFLRKSGISFPRKWGSVHLWPRPLPVILHLLHESRPKNQQAAALWCQDQHAEGGCHVSLPYSTDIMYCCLYFFLAASIWGRHRSSIPTPKIQNPKWSDTEKNSVSASRHRATSESHTSAHAMGHTVKTDTGTLRILSFYIFQGMWISWNLNRFTV